MVKLFMYCLTFLCRKQISWENTKPFVPNIKYAKVIKVYDGDTITVAARIHPLICEYYRFSVRLAHIDCPELKTKDEYEKDLAKKAKNKLEDLILNQYIELNVLTTDKYGRLLAEIKYNNKSINDWMLKNKMAVSYDGKKKSPVNWASYYEENKFCEFKDF